MANGLFGGGNGTVLHPYIIEDAYDLLKMNDGLSFFYKLGADIDLSVLKQPTYEYSPGETIEEEKLHSDIDGEIDIKVHFSGWEPIGRHYVDLNDLSKGTDNSLRFSGGLDGDGHSIKNLFIDRVNADRQGLFGYLNNGIIKNLKIENASVVGRNNTGILAGHIESNSLIENCEIIDSSMDGNSQVGAFSGHSNSSTIRKARLLNTIIDNRSTYCGGIVGYITAGSYEDIFTKNVILNYRSSYAGMMCSYSGSGAVFNRIACVNVDINGDSSYAAGLMGYTTSCNISNVKITGIVRGNSYTSGVIGYLISTPMTNIVASVRCERTNTSYSGSVVGRWDGRGAQTRFIWNEDVTNDFGSNHSIRSNTNEMTTFPRYEGFETEELPDETKVWEFKFGHYPRLYLEDDFEEDGLQHEIKEGSGTESDPYVVTNPRELDLMRNDLKSHYKLGNDIDLDIAPYNEDGYRQPIGTNRLVFTGSLDGSGFTIKNLKSNITASYSGLFGYMQDSKVKDLKIENSILRGRAYTGALSGHILRCEISNVEIIDSEIDATGNYSGILTGSSSSSDFYKLKCSGVLRSTVEYAGAFGGLSSCNIDESIFDIHVIGVNYIGVVSGVINTSTITNCRTEGSAACSGSYVAGLAGEMNNSTAINFYSTAFIQGGSAAGIVSYHRTGSITGTNCYWDIEESNVTSSRIGLGMDSVDMKSPAYYVDWDREERVDTSKIWQFKFGEYPRLWFEEELTQDDDEFVGGSGTENDPYLIGTVRQLLCIKRDLSAHYKLVDDIDLTDSEYLGEKGWAGIGLNHVRFTGSLDGGGYSIIGLKIRDTLKDNNGLFGFMKDAKVRHLFMKNVDIFGRSYLGAIAGRCENTSFESISIEGRVRGTSYLGGLLGEGSSDTNAVHSACNVTGTNWLGGLIGDSAVGSNVINSYSSGNIEGVNGNRGGLIGYNRAVVRNCYSVARIVNGNGGLLGGCNGTASESYWDRERSNFATSAKGFPLTTLELQSFYSTRHWSTERIRGITVWKTRYKEYPRLWFEPDFEGVDQTYFAGGDGSVSDPYLIRNIVDLDYMRNNLEAHYKLIENLDLNDGEYVNDSNWVPVGTESLMFLGSLDGNNKTIRSVVINRPTESRQGLFGEARDASFKNIKMENININASNNSAMLVGRDTFCNIDNCHLTGVVNCSSSYVGGLSGRSYDSTILNSSVNSLNITGSSYVGGLIGETRSEIKYCFSKSKVSGSTFIGGVIGSLVGPSGLLEDSYSSGEIEGTSSHTGGVVGYNYATVRNVFANNTQVQGGGCLGGISGSTQTDLVWDREKSGMTSCAGSGLLVNSEEMRTFTPFRGWENKTNANGDKAWKFKYKNLPRLWFEKDFEGVENHFIGGDGTPNNPYMIQTPEALDFIRNDLGASYKLARDIDLNIIPFNEGNGWRPIGYENLFFNGTLDGDDCAIRNLYIRSQTRDYAGLFSRIIDAKIENLKMDRTSIIGRSYIGNIAGMSNNSKMELCSIENAEIEGVNDLGGFIGRMNTSSEVLHSTHSGVILGQANIGGITGYSTTSSRIWSCSTRGRQRNTGSYNGGIVGYNLGSSVVQSCYSNSSIETLSTYAGGLVGYNTAIIRSSYSTGTIRNDNSQSHVGGLVGNSTQVLNDCFWDTTASRMTTSQQGLGIATEQMNLARTFYDADWKDDRLPNGASVWFIGDNKYPTLWMDGFEKLLIKSKNRVYSVNDSNELVEVTNRINNINTITKEEFLDLGFNYLEEMQLFGNKREYIMSLSDDFGSRKVYKETIDLSKNTDTLKIEVI